MSLINDALKKAARQRAQAQAQVVPPMPGGSGPGRRRSGVQSWALAAGAALALIVVSAVVTGIVLSGHAPERPVSPTQAPAAAPTVASAPPATVTVSLPLAAASPSKPLANTPSPTPQPSPVAVAAAAVPAPAEPTAVPVAIKVSASSGGIQDVVDAFHVLGVRSAGSESKALVDGHVYKLNDLVDRGLGLRLIKIEADHLTFADSSGAQYVKSF